MSHDVGRSAALHWGDESPIPLIAAVREKSMASSHAPVDVTNDDSAGWRTLIDKAQTRSVDISFSGVTDDDVLRADSFAADGAGRFQNFEFRFYDGAILSGKGYLSEYTETHAHDSEITFEATIMSSGALTYTPAA